MRYGPTFANPALFVALFKLFGFKNRIIVDPSPHTGSKAIAAAISGLRYMPLTDFSYPIEHGIENIGLEVIPADNQYDVVFLDNNFKQVDINDVLSWRRRCRELVAFLKPEQYREIVKVMKPNRFVRVRTRPVVRNGYVPDYLAHFKD